jgi:hypothetical protein
MIIKNLRGDKSPRRYKNYYLNYLDLFKGLKLLFLFTDFVGLRLNVISEEEFFSTALAFDDLPSEDAFE